MATGSVPIADGRELLSRIDEVLVVEHRFRMTVVEQRRIWRKQLWEMTTPIYEREKGAGP